MEAKNLTAVSIIGLLVLFAILWAFILPFTGGRMMGSNWDSTNGGMMGSNSMMGRNIDAHFIEQMIPHHEEAIEMAELALDRSENSEIRNLATQIISAQRQEIEDMRSWYEEWYNREPSDYSFGMMGGRGMGMMFGDTEDLSRAQNFEQEFIRQMIPHHQTAIMMAQMLLRGTDRPELKDLATQIISTQAAEIETMRGIAERL